jgi:hypothetical protein
LKKNQLPPHNIDFTEGLTLTGHVPSQNTNLSWFNKFTTTGSVRAFIFKYYIVLALHGAQRLIWVIFNTLLSLRDLSAPCYILWEALEKDILNLAPFQARTKRNMTKQEIKEMNKNSDLLQCVKKNFHEGITRNGEMLWTLFDWCYFY